MRPKTVRHLRCFSDVVEIYGSRFTGEARLVHEINQGLFGEGIELVPNPFLSLFSRRIYRFFRLPRIDSSRTPANATLKS